MKHKDLKNCSICDKGLSAEGLPIFAKFTVQRFGLDRAAIQRAHGLEQIMGGHALLANIMGPDEDLARPLEDKQDVLVCGLCLTSPLPQYFWMKE